MEEHDAPQRSRFTRLAEGDVEWEGEPRRVGGGVRLLAVFVALLVLGGTAWIVFSGRDSAADPAMPGAEQVQTSSTPTGSTSTTTGKPAAPLVTAVPTAAPKGVTWELFQSVAVPSSKTAGPRIRQGAVRTGYEHSPEGALIAALQISTTRLLAPGDSWKAVNLEQVLPGAGRDRFIRLRAQVTDDGPPPNGYGQVAGFKFISYTPDVAVIEFAKRYAGQATFQVSNLTVRWDRGDWRLALQPDGSDYSTVSTIASIESFIPFAGV